MNIVYTPLHSIEGSARALHQKHQISQLYMMEKLYLLSLYKEQVPLLEGSRVTIIALDPINPAGARQHSIRIGPGYLRLLEVWRPHVRELLHYMLAIEDVRKAAGTRFPAKSLYHRIEHWITHSQPRWPEPKVFPWPPHVYATHRTHLTRYGYEFDEPLSDTVEAENLWPVPPAKTKLRPKPAFERILERIRKG